MATLPQLQNNRTHTNKIEYQSHEQYNFGGETENPAPNNQSGGDEETKSIKNGQYSLLRREREKIRDTPRRGR